MPRKSLSKDDFEAWRAHPVTELLHRYLADYEERIRQEWAQGLQWTDEAKFRVQNLSDLRNTTLSDIEKFYEEPEDDEQDDDSGE